MFCNNCGFRYEPNAKFCKNCGTAKAPTQPVFAPPYTNSETPPKKSVAPKIWISIIVGIMVLAAIIGALFQFVFEPPDSEAEKYDSDVPEPIESDEYALDLQETQELEQYEHILPESRSGLPLQNAVEWGLSDDIILDEFLFSSVNDNDTTTKRILFPGKWPEEYFGRAIPEYLGYGYMYILIVTAPSEHYTDHNYAEVISLSIYENCEEDLGNFIEKLFGEGFYETAKEELPDDDRFALEHGFFDTLRRFTTDTTTVRIMRSRDEMGPFLQITVIMNDRIQAREPWR